MIISSTNAIHYFLERGYLTFESVVDGDLMVVNGSSNHRNVKIIRQNSPGYFVKQAKQWDAPAATSLQREAVCYWLGHNDPDFASIKHFLPDYHGYDFNNNLLIVELVSGGITLFQYFSRADSYSAKLYSEMGRSLAVFHRGAGGRMDQSTRSLALGKSVPWILTIHRQPPATTTFNSLSSELLFFIQNNPQFYYCLEALQRQWRYDSFIHGDIKLDNYIIDPDPEKTAEPAFKIIDWELAGFGDAAWDLGSAFQAFISFPLISMQATGEQPPATLERLLQSCSPDIRMAVRDLWIGYIGSLPISENMGELLDRSIGSCAARLIQTGFECAETLKGGELAPYADLMKAKAFCLTAVALDIFQNPGQAIRLLLTDQ